MNDYQLLTGFFHSLKLKWSYGAIRGRAEDTWHKRVSALPLAKRLQVLSFVGFKGIYVDRRAYKKGPLKKLEKELMNLLKVKPIESPDKSLAFFSMESYNKNFMTGFSESEKEVTRNYLLHPDGVASWSGIHK